MINNIVKYIRPWVNTNIELQLYFECRFSNVTVQDQAANKKCRLADLQVKTAETNYLIYM